MNHALSDAWSWSTRHSPLLRMVRWLCGKLRPHAGASEVIDASGLPEAVRLKIDTIVRRTGLWHDERADIARELTSHAREAMAASPSRTSGDVAADLGDPKVVSRLLRRSARRKRPPAWRIRHRTIQVFASIVCVLVVAYGILFARFNLATPEVKRNFIVDLYERNAGYGSDEKALPAIEELWIAYKREQYRLESVRERKADARYNQPPTVSHDEGPERWAFHRMWEAEPADRSYDEFVRWMESIRPLLDSVEAAADRPILGGVYSDQSVEIDVDDGTIRLVRPIPPDADPTKTDNMIGVLLPWLGQTRAAARMLCADAVLAARSGDAGRARDRVIATLRLGALHGREPFLLSNLVGFAIAEIGQETMLRIVHEQPDLFSRDDLTALCHTVASTHERTRRFDLESERMMFEDLLQRGFTDDGSGDGRLTARGLRLLAEVGSLEDSGLGFDFPVSHEASAVLIGPLSGIVVASRAEHRSMYDRLLSIADDIVESDPPALARVAPGGDLDAAYQAEIDGSLRFPLIRIMLPGIGRIASVAHESDARAGAACLALAAHVHRKQTGDWPSSAEQLTPGLIPSLPMDPFDPGRPLRLVADGKGILIYSVGTDGNDDGGRAPGTRRGHGERDLMRRYTDPGVLGSDDRPTVDADWILYPPER